MHALIFRPEFAHLILQPHSGDVQLSPVHGEVIIDLDESNGYGMKIEGLPDSNPTPGMYLCISELDEIFKSNNPCQ